MWRTATINLKANYKHNHKPPSLNTWCDTRYLLPPTHTRPRRRPRVFVHHICNDPIFYQYHFWSVWQDTPPGHWDTLLSPTLATQNALVAMIDVKCCIDTIKFKGACGHYDITTFCDVCETANRLRLLSFTSTLRGGDVDECVWVGVDSEYHHQPWGQKWMFWASENIISHLFAKFWVMKLKPFFGKARWSVKSFISRNFFIWSFL